MERTLGVRLKWVKNAGFFAVAAGLGAAVWAGAGGCGSAPPPVRHVDPYAERVANCIVVPRPKNDAAQAQMALLPAGSAVLGSVESERAQARRDYGKGGERLFGNEGRARRAHVSAFRIDRVPVTNALYAEFSEACGIA